MDMKRFFINMEIHDADVLGLISDVGFVSGRLVYTATDMVDKKEMFEALVNTNTSQLPLSYKALEILVERLMVTLAATKDNVLYHGVQSFSNDFWTVNIIDSEHVPHGMRGYG